MNAKRIPKRHIQKIRRLKRHVYHPILHATHHRHKMSYRTLYYIKSFGNDRHMWHAIVKQSIKILILASILSTIGGFWIEGIQSKLLLFTPLLILLPALDDMIGDYGCTIGSKFSTMLYLKRVGKKWWHSKDLHDLVTTVFIVAFISSVYIGLLSSAISVVQGFVITEVLAIKVLAISIICTMLLVGIICLIAFVCGLYFFRKGEDPNNFLIPITTSVADFGSLIIFTLLVITFV